MGQVVVFPVEPRQGAGRSPVIADYYCHRAKMHEDAPAYLDTLDLVALCMLERLDQLPASCLGKMFLEAELRRIAYLVMPFRMGWN